MPMFVRNAPFDLSWISTPFFFADAESTPPTNWPSVPALVPA